MGLHFTELKWVWNLKEIHVLIPNLLSDYRCVREKFKEFLLHSATNKKECHVYIKN